MSNTIDLFMWGYQQHTQVSLQVEAESLFNEIESKLNPHVFLIGLLVEERKDRHEICIEPEDCGYKVSAFKDVKKLAQELEKVDEERQLFHSHPIAQKNQDIRIGNKALSDAIIKILKREDLYGKTEKFISYPTYIDGFLVFVVLEIHKEGLDKHYSLTKTKFNDRFKINRSFIESSINVYLKEAANGLKDPTKAMNIIERTNDELLVESARQFTYAISRAGGNFEGLHGLYDSCNSIASLKYEGAEGLGKMIIARKDHPNINLTLQLEEPISIRDYRKVRKFLELSDDNSIIISDSSLIYGLGVQNGRYNPKDESLFVIHFLSHYRWEVLHDNNCMMVVEYRQPNIPKDRIDREKFYSDISRVFKGIEKTKIDTLWNITLQATLQSHGTMLVISGKAKEEATRLKNQSFSVKQLKLTTDVIYRVTTIDGAVMLDDNSDCYAIGVILDGIATDKGDSARGARYNSAIRYFENSKGNYPLVIIIISEDGMINLIPNLKPQIKHSTITNEIEKFKRLGEFGKPDVKVYYSLLNYFENIEFYLSELECQQINDKRKHIEAGDFLGKGIHIMHTDLKPNSEMNDSYYLEE